MITRNISMGNAQAPLSSDRQENTNKQTAKTHTLLLSLYRKKIEANISPQLTFRGIP